MFCPKTGDKFTLVKQACSEINTWLEMFQKLEKRRVPVVVYPPPARYSARNPRKRLQPTHHMLTRRKKGKHFNNNYYNHHCINKRIIIGLPKPTTTRAVFYYQLVLFMLKLIQLFNQKFFQVSLSCLIFLTP